LFELAPLPFVRILIFGHREDSRQVGISWRGLENRGALVVHRLFSAMKKGRAEELADLRSRTHRLRESLNQLIQVSLSGASRRITTYILTFL